MNYANDDLQSRLQWNYLNEKIELGPDVEKILLFRNMAFSVTISYLTMLCNAFHRFWICFHTQAGSVSEKVLKT